MLIVYPFASATVRVGYDHLALGLVYVEQRVILLSISPPPAKPLSCQPVTASLCTSACIRNTRQGKWQIER